MVASTPRARASSISRRVSTLFPQFWAPMILWCVTCVARPPSSPIRMVSRTLSTTPAASSRMCEMYMPPNPATTLANSITSSVGVKLPGT